MAWTGKGMALNALNKSDEAIKAFDKVIEIDPRNSDVWTGKGFVLNILNNYDKVIKAFDKAIEINP
jgi:tetratricopeptide (TPR) repeat protein